MNVNESVPANPPATTAAPSPEPPSFNTAHWKSEDLLHGLKEVLIQHGNDLYRLRLTRQGKLILYK